MAHELTRNLNGEYEMAYFGATPWHRLGQALAAEATSQQIIEAARLDWAVELQPVYRVTGAWQGDHQLVVVPGVKAVVRTDNLATLGTVSDRYKVVQNREAFELMDAVIGESGAFYHTAGSIRGGQKVWALAKLPDTLMAGHDAVDQYLLMVSDHTGRAALHLRFVGIRVVCANTLGAAMAREAKHQCSVIHSGNITRQVAEVRKALGLAKTYFGELSQDIQFLTSRQITDLQMRGYAQSVFPITAVMPEDEQDRWSRVHQVLAGLFRTGRGNDVQPTAGTPWAAYNAVTEYLDHVAARTSKGTRRAGADEAVLFGRGLKIKDRAWGKALELVNG